MKKHFILIHGHGHGAWCWYKITALLTSAGHQVTKQIDEVWSLSDYWQPLKETMASLPEEEKVVLVGHSFGGMSLSLAMEVFPEKISVAIFVSALMLGVNLTYSAMQDKYKKDSVDLMDWRFVFDNGVDKPPTAFVFGPVSTQPSRGLHTGHHAREASAPVH